MSGFRRIGLAIAVIASVALFAATSSDASAFGYSYYGSSGYSVGYGISYSGWGCCEPAYCCYRPGQLRRMARRAYRRSWCAPTYAYSACCVSRRSLCCCVPCCDPCCDPCCGVVSYSTYSVTDPCCGGAVIDSALPYSTPTYSEPATPTPADGVSPTPADIPAETPTPQPAEDAATLRLEVPTDAVVFVNGAPTKSKGAFRSYVSRGLQRGSSYTYRIRVEYTRNGRPVQERRIVRLTVGSDTRLAFGQPAFGQPVRAERIAAKPVDTSVTLHVPAEAKVFLAGNPTHQVGEFREFTTHRLSVGETWADYTVLVEVERNGRTVSQERTLDLAAGDSRELTFTFGDAKLAQLDR